MRVACVFCVAVVAAVVIVHKTRYKNEDSS